ncbi:DUF1737 domain-containing protein [Lactococcus formosensis]|uniref:DUF1737 domain-containing protein n=1 Tax=Lactococcus formosensis TaxID=1281486 RepID=UPI002097F396|nr:DUF1737 domain-containing protein [Lactococcus formosensis]MCO7181589.1 DUF1737 domain-containing protein [Lactococcus formosensis]
MSEYKTLIAPTESEIEHSLAQYIRQGWISSGKPSLVTNVDYDTVYTIAIRKP